MTPKRTMRLSNGMEMDQASMMGGAAAGALIMGTAALVAIPLGRTPWRIAGITLALAALLVECGTMAMRRHHAERTAPDPARRITDDLIDRLREVQGPKHRHVFTPGEWAPEIGERVRVRMSDGPDTYGEILRLPVFSNLALVRTDEQKVILTTIDTLHPVTRDDTTDPAPEPEVTPAPEPEVTPAYDPDAPAPRIS